MESKIGHPERLAARPARRFHETPARISMRSARAAYFGPGLDLAPHRNAVAVVALAVDDPFELALLGANRSAPAYKTLRAALIGPGRLHHLKAPGPMAFVYLDALSDDHAAVQQVDLAAVCKVFNSEPLENWSVDRACAALNLPRRSPSDSRIAAIFGAIDHHPDAFINFQDIATALGLSPSRCRTLIREATGVSFRRYRIWRRMAFVALNLSEGRTLTEAAHAAGFASSAHLSFSFKKMFGLAPSALLKARVAFDVD